MLSTNRLERVSNFSILQKEGWATTVKDEGNNLIEEYQCRYLKTQSTLNRIRFKLILTWFNEYNIQVYSIDRKKLQRKYNYYANETSRISKDEKETQLVLKAEYFEMKLLT